MKARRNARLDLAALALTLLGAISVHAQDAMTGVWERADDSGWHGNLHLVEHESNLVLATWVARPSGPFTKPVYVLEGLGTRVGDSVIIFFYEPLEYESGICPDLWGFLDVLVVSASELLVEARPIEVEGSPGFFMEPVLGSPVVSSGDRKPSKEAGAIYAMECINRRR